MSKALAGYVVSRILKNPRLRLGLATGFSPQLSYELIGNQLNESQVRQSNLKIVQLDEWYGVKPTETASCNYYLKKNVVESWRLTNDQVLWLDGTPIKAMSELNKLKSALAKDPLDLCILGLGYNGHLALNEPGSVVSESSRIVVLDAQSRDHSMLNDHQEKVTKGMTIGLKEIMTSREIVLIIAGHGKTRTYRKLLTRPVALEFPASVLFDHPNWICVVDQTAINPSL